MPPRKAVGTTFGRATEAPTGTVEYFETVGCRWKKCGHK